MHWNRAGHVSKSIILFRKFLSIYIVYYYLHFVWRLDFVFGPEGMVDLAKLGGFRYPSIFHFVQNSYFIHFAYGIVLVLAVALGRGILNRPGVWLLFLLNLSFQNANPYIIHEPQQLMNLFILFFAGFLPVRDEETFDPFIVKTIIVSLGVYYFVAGVKKLPDPLWRQGLAVGMLVEWEGLSGGFSNVLRSLLRMEFFNKVTTFFTFVFELTFVLVCLSRWRFLWMSFGVLLHLGIAMVMEVGTFSAVMLVWYALLWNLDEAKGRIQA